jgi:stage II sporulation protein D (peptidoglycan lytic transglycosylase)
MASCYPLRVLFCSLVLSLLLPLQAAAMEVKVLILESASQLTLSCDAHFQISRYDSIEFVHDFPSYQKVLVLPQPDGWRIGDQEVASQNLKVETDPSSFLEVNDRPFRGRLEIHQERGKRIQVVNVLDLEDYLRGVIREEISPQWPLEALKAQAVVARTFALRQVLDNPGQLFHLKCTTDSQVYGGKQREDFRSDWAVRDTAGIVLTYQGKPIPAFYHAACGGHTEDVADVWSFNHASLQGVPCGYCAYHPVYTWQASLRKEEIRRALLRWGCQLGEIEAILPVTRSKTGRILQLEVRHAGGRTLMEGKKFRQCLGYDLIRSTNFSVNRENGVFTFLGKGWGHGVGLCQWGAKGMAELAFSYEAILQHYYPGTRLARMEELGD